jgi:hypothetical protein
MPVHPTSPANAPLDTNVRTPRDEEASQVADRLRQEELRRAAHLDDHHDKDDDCVDEQSRETFPASDPPSNY